MVERLVFEDRPALASALANDVAKALEADIEARGYAVLAVSGGSTPKRFFKALSATDIAWSNVKITLVDERLVPDTNERSNAKLVQDHLLQNLATTATFLPLYREGLDADATTSALQSDMASLMPLSAAVLGMGTDGHTASFFPGGSHLSAAIDPQTDALFSPMQAEAAGENRMTFTLPPLLDAAFLALHIEGEEKEMILHEAEQNLQPHRIQLAVEAMPVRVVLNAKPQLPVYWAP